ncbi:hypothetical protein SAMN02910400_01395 [Lachnospiraceae bacterium C10]|nr:hypothetical protein SAMN02910400_01395 [Lachnospiraceae bacterium C10]
MPKPKHSFGKKDFEVKEEFIDREEAKRLYRDKLNNNQKEYNILVFYGVGGIGKSKLRREISRIHKEENKEGITFYLDLNAPEDRNMGEGILKLVDSCDTKIDFKCFELAYALYFRKKNPSAQYGRDKEMFVENTFVGVGLNILSIFDNGVTGTAAEIVERTIRTIVNRAIDKEVKEELKNFDSYSIAEMEEMLPLFFQYDLQSYLKKHKDAKVLIIFDTFEALNENVIEQIHRSKNERWVQEIIEYFPHDEFPKLLVTIFGRDELTWDEEWQDLLEQHKLVEFEDQYSEDYLRAAGITDEPIIRTIIKSSRGYPFLLYLSLETYANIKNGGRHPEITDFGGSYPEIVERFIYNLDKDTVEVLRLMSIPNFYNDDIFNLLIREFNISFPMTEFEQFNKYSFVSYDKNEKNYHIHDLMRKGILEKSSESTILAAHRVLLKYYADKINLSVANRDVLEMFYHARMCMTTEEFNRWLMTPINVHEGLTPLTGMKKKQQKGEQKVLMQIINGIRSNHQIKDLSIDLVNIYIDIVHLGGDYDEAVSICEKYLSQYSKDEISADEQLTKMRVRKIHHSMFYLPVDQLISEAEEILEGLDIKKYPEQYNELLFLLGGNLGVLSGNLERASMWLEMSMVCAQKNNLDAFIQRTIRKQADIMLANGDTEGALKLISQTVKASFDIEDIDSRYKIYLMGVLGEIYRKMDELETAWHCYDIVDKKSTENYLPGWQAHSYLAKGMVELQRGNYSEAEILFAKAINTYTRIQQEWGIINTKQAAMLLKKYQDLPISIDEVNQVLEEATKMNYRYNINFSSKLINEEKPYLQLFFL